MLPLESFDKRQFERAIAASGQTCNPYYLLAGRQRHAKLVQSVIAGEKHMSNLWKLIFGSGAILLAAMALYALWFDTLAPVVFAKAFISLVVIGLVLTVLQSTFNKPAAPPE